MVKQNPKSKKCSLKALSLAAITGLVSMVAGVCNAEASLPTPTLGDNSAYLFNQVDSASNNTIVLPTYNNENGLVDAINYEVGINKTIYGSGDLSKTYPTEIFSDYKVDYVTNYSATDLHSQVIVKKKDAAIDYSGVWMGLNKPSKSGSYYIGSAITNFGYKIGNISGLFVENSVSSSALSWGGAIVLRGTAGSVTADFISNSAYSTSESAGGALVVAVCKPASVVGDFIGNHADGVNSVGWGGAVFVVNNADIGLLKGDFIGNYTTSVNSGAYGGAIEVNWNGKITNIEGDFIGNYADGVSSLGGAIHNGGRIDIIKGDFISNYGYSLSGSAIGGAIANDPDARTTMAVGIGSITSNFYNNAIISSTGNVYGGAIYNSAIIEEMASQFYGNYAKSLSGKAFGGAIYNRDVNLDITDTTFVGNYAISETDTAQGGAIWTNSDMNFKSDSKDMIFAGNYTISNGVKDDNAIYVDSADATLNFELKNKANLILKDNIDGLAGYNVNVIGDLSNTFYMHNDIRNANLSLANLQSINVVDNYARTYNLNSLTLDGNTNIIPEVDFVNNTMDRFVTGNNYSIAQGTNLNIQELLWLNEPVKDLTTIQFAEQGLKDNVTYNGSTQVTTPIYVYDISYKNDKDGGYFVFARGSATPDGAGFNPTVLSSSVNSTVGAMGTMNQTFTYSFQNSDNYMNIPYVERMAYKNRNRYAISSLSDGRFSPLFSRDEYGSVWVKPYATFESISLDNGPKVSNIAYGTLVGFDTGVEAIGRGWDRAITGFVGYNGANQNYRGVDSIQNGGMLGGTLTLYKNNFFNATTVSVGASVANNQTMFGNEDYAMLMSGIANKSGYNVEFKDGKFIIQPTLLLSYTFVNTFDYTNAAGVRMSSDPYHSLQLSPGVKFIGNSNGGWQPYLAVSMVWNLMGDSNAYANGVRLPSMTIKPYVQYGLGIQKRIKHHFMAFGQAMVQNGGRNGVSLTCGFRWAVGCDKCKHKHQKVEVVNDKNKFSQVDEIQGSKVILKQMTSQQRQVSGGKIYNNFRVASNVNIKQY